MKRRHFIKGSAIVGLTLAHAPLIAESGMFQTLSQRKVFRILKADAVNVGTLPVLRAFAGDHLDHVSPYVLFDEFGPVTVVAGSDPLRVNAHPHAGVTPTTYFFEGTGHHKDSLNYDFQIGKGDFMMFNSGRGAIHMEESGKLLQEKGGQYHGFQIWLNTPSKYKFIEPTTEVHQLPNMDVIETSNYRIKVILGELSYAKSKISTLTPAFYYHITMKEDCRLDIPVDPQDNAFIYLVSGSIELEGNKELEAHRIAIFERDGDNIQIYAKKASELLLLGGTPLNERVYSYGPFVMNDKEQIIKCIENYQTGKMGNPDLVNARF